MDLFGVGIYSLIIYIAAVLVISVVLKRRMAEQGQSIYFSSNKSYK